MNPFLGLSVVFATVAATAALESDVEADVDTEFVSLIQVEVNMKNTSVQLLGKVNMKNTSVQLLGKASFVPQNSTLVQNLQAVDTPLSINATANSSRHQLTLHSSAVDLVNSIVAIPVPTDVDGSKVVQGQLGVNQNSGNDLQTLETSLVFNIAMIALYLAIFAGLKWWQPIMYLDNTLQGKAPEPKPSWYGLWLTMQEVQDCAGLDAAMMVEFCNLGMKMSAILGIPMIVLLCPTYATFAAHADAASRHQCPMPADSSYVGGALYSISISTLPCQTAWIHWALAILVWVVVYIVQEMVRRAHKAFVKRRISWLQERPKPQSTTLLVQNIPARYCSDIMMKNYFEHLFPNGAIERVYVVKHLRSLANLIEEFDSLEQELHEALFKWDQVDRDPEKRPMMTLPVDSIQSQSFDRIEYFTKLIQENLEKIEVEREKIASTAHHEHRHICASVAFVTFRDKRDAELALSLRLEPEGGVFTLEYSPGPGDVRYNHLMRRPTERKMMHVLGYALIFLLFLFFFPLIGLTSSVINVQNLQNITPIHNFLSSAPFMESFVEGIFASLVLSLFMAFLPTVLNAIILNLFTLKAEAESQYYLQQWYFWFQVVFVLLVTSVGSSLWRRVGEILDSPKSMLFLLADTVPNTSNFYMNYVILQWATSALLVTRYMNLLKFLAWKAVCSEERAKQKSEPEDGDYYGIGSRSARLSLILATGLVFCVIAPVILVFVFIFFFIHRWVYSYLMVFAETRKPDLGGVYWCLQLRHLQLSVPIYIITMAGCMWSSSEAPVGPGTLALLSLGMWAYEYSKWVDILWETLPFRAVVEGIEKGTHSTTGEVYVQSELSRELVVPSVSAKAGD